MSIFKSTKNGNSLNNNIVSKTSNLISNNNKTISSYTVQIDSTHKKIDKNSRSLNLNINSTANLVNNHQLASKLEKINDNPYNNYIGSNVVKSYKNFNEINSVFKEKNDHIKDKMGKNNFNNQGNNQANQKMLKFSTNFNNYKMIRPHKNNVINFNKSSQIVKSQLNKGNQNYKQSFDLDKPLMNLHISQNQLIEKNLNCRLLDVKSDNDKGLPLKNMKILNKQSNKHDKINYQSSYLGHKSFFDLDINIKSSKSKSPLLKKQEIDNLNSKVNESYNINLAELNNKASKFSRNEKKNEFNNIYLNTINTPNNLGKPINTNQNNLNKNHLTCYTSYNLNENNAIFIDSNNKPKNNKSIDSIKNIYLGINQQSYTCVNKEQKQVFPNFSEYNELRKQINMGGVFNNKSNPDLHEMVVNSDSNKINDFSKAQIKDYNKLQNVNKLSTLNLFSNENCKSKKNLINPNKKNDNSVINPNINYFISQNKNTSVNILSETPSNKKVFKDSKFK